MVSRTPIFRCLVASLLLLPSVAGRGEPPSRPARLLAVSVTTGFRHGSIGTAEGVLEDLGRRNGLWHIDYLRMPPGQPGDAAWKEDLAARFARAFAAESLADLDGVMFVSTTGDLPLPDIAAFLDWIGTGKAFVGFHAASDTLKNSDAYVEMIGGHFAGHPWNAGGEHGFVVHEPGHRLTSMFPPRFRWKDEIYQYDPRYRPENLRVLVSLDMAASTPKHPWHVPVSWVRNHGRGRVFYTNFGHNESTWQDAAFQQHIAEGVAWALGRFEAPAEPNPEVQAAEDLRSVIAAAAETVAADHGTLRARADGKISADPAWAVRLWPTLRGLRDMKPADRRAVYLKLIAEIEE